MYPMRRSNARRRFRCPQSGAKLRRVRSRHKTARPSTGATACQNPLGREDLEAWMNGPQWAAPASGAPFGKIEVDYCKERRSAAYACSAMVVGTQRVPGQQSSGPIESVSATLNAEGTVRVHWERNG